MAKLILSLFLITLIVSGTGSAYATNHDCNINANQGANYVVQQNVDYVAPQVAYAIQQPQFVAVPVYGVQNLNGYGQVNQLNVVQKQRLGVRRAAVNNSYSVAQVQRVQQINKSKVRAIRQRNKNVSKVVGGY